MESYKDKKKRRKKLFEQGPNVKQIAREEGATERTIYEWGKNHGYIDDRIQARKKSNKATDRMEKFIAILAAKKEIQTQDQVGQVLKLVKEGVFDDCRVVKK